MESVIKTYLGFFFLIAMLFIGSGLLSASLDARNANAMANMYATRVEQSNYAYNVIQEVKAEAENFGYQVSIDVRTSDNNTYSHYGLLTLRYNYRIPILGIRQSHNVLVDLN